MNIIHIFDISRVTQDHAERWRFRDDNLKFFALIDIKAKKIVRPAQQTKLDHHRKLGMKVKTARLGQKDRQSSDNRSLEISNFGEEFLVIEGEFDAA